jgi:proteasome lid subunit RPN8/RPN11
MERSRWETGDCALTENPTHRRWSLEGQRRTVQCDLKVLNALGATAREGFTRFPHGGAEVGGILLGTLQGDTVQIVDTRPLPIEYAGGASFVLSESDAEALRRLIRTSAAEVVGWYVSHTRRDLTPNESDVAIYDGFFSKPGQVYMIIKPDKLDDARMAVFSRGEDGALLEYSTHEDIVEEAQKKEPAPEQRAEALPPVFTQPPQPNSTRRYWLGALAVTIGGGAAWFASSGHKQTPAVPATPPAPINTPAQPVPKPEPPPPPQIQADGQRERKAKRVRTRRRRRAKKSKAQASQP